MIDWITETIGKTGYLGIVLLMFAENIFPPIPSELIMPLAGFNAARGQLGFLLVVLSGTLGSVLGALPWYWAGRALGQERLERFADRHGRWLTLNAQDIRGAVGWFERHCGKAILIGRVVPTVRTLISVPAGIFRMGLTRFLILTSAGSLVWVAGLTAAGYWLENEYRQVSAYVDPVAKGLLGLLVLIYLYRLVTWRPQA